MLVDINNIDSLIRYITKGISIDNNYSYSNKSSLLDIKALSDFFSEKYLERVYKFFIEDEIADEFLKFLLVLKEFNYSEFNKIIKCGDTELEMVCENGHIFVVEGKCNSKYCPFCCKARGLKFRRILKSFLKYSEEPLPLRFFTLTWKNTPRLSLELRDRYRRDFKNLKQRLKRYGYIIHKGIKSLEVKYNNNTGFNTHLHLLVYASYKPNKRFLEKRVFFEKHGEKNGYINKKFLSNLWKDITGDSYIVDTQIIRRGIKGGVNYLCKYISKFEGVYNLNCNKLIEFDNFSKNLRVVEKFGFKRSETLAKHKLICICPYCGARVIYDPHVWGKEKVMKPLILLPLIEIPKNQWSITEIRKYGG